MLWGLIYSLLEGLRPGYFDISLDLLEENRLLCIYYSFITLPTLGYSDISPLISLSVRYLCWKRLSANSIWRCLSLAWGPSPQPVAKLVIPAVLNAHRLYTAG